jgi:hypothetical protein
MYPDESRPGTAFIVGTKPNLIKLLVSGVIARNQLPIAQRTRRIPTPVAG